MAYSPENNPYIPGDPYSYDLKWIIEKIKNMSGQYESLSQAMAALKDEFDTFISTLDVEDYVKEYLDEMYDDGRLENIIKKYLAPQNAHIVRSGRLLDRFTINGTTQKLYAQGAFYADGKYYVCGSWDNETIQSITVWNNNGVYVNGDDTYTQLYHANDIAKIGTKLYIATGEDRVAIVDADTLAYEGDLPGINTLGYSTCSALGVDGDKLIICGSTGSYLFGFAIYDTSNSSLIKKAWDIYKPNDVNQGGCFYNGHYYRLFNKDLQVGEFDIDTGDLINVYNLPDNDSYFYVGEPESLFVKDDKIFILGDTYAPDFTLHMYNSALCQIFESDITGAALMNYYPNYMQPWSPATIQINQNAAYEFNPTTVFTAAEEVNALVRDMVIELVNCTTGYVWRHGQSLTIYGAGTNRTLERVRLYGSMGRLHSCTINNFVMLQSNADINYSTINAIECRYGSINALSSRLILNITQQANIKHIVNSYSGWIDGSVYTFEDGTTIDQIAIRPSNANMTQYILPNINAILAPFPNTITSVLSITVLTDTNHVGKLETSFTKTEWMSGFTRTIGEWSLTIGANGASISVQRNGSAVTVSRYSDVHVLITA